MATKKKRSDVSARTAANKNKDFSCVVIKWNTFCNDNIIKNEIERFVLNVNKIAFEAYHVVNIHILRCLTENIELPTLNQTFFYRCCTGVVEKYGIQSSGSDVGDSDLDETLIQYKSLRPKENYMPPTKENMGVLMCNLARQMDTACHNHLILNFNKRLMRYVRLKYKMNRIE